MSKTMESILKICIICKKTEEEEPGVKQYKSINVVRSAAEKRLSLSCDKFASATRSILTAESADGLYYHTSCNSRYCAVKRKSTEESTSASPTCNVKTLRSKSDYHQSDAKGVLEASCIFCSVVRKRLKPRSGKASFEKLHKVETIEFSRGLMNAAKSKPHLPNCQRILALGSEDLVAIEAHYHVSCRLKFFNETKEDSKTGSEEYVSNRGKHDKAFEVFTAYIEYTIIQKSEPQYIQKLKTLYKEHYKELWGDDEDIDLYLSHNFIRKLRNKFSEKLTIGKNSNKEGNFIYPQDMELDVVKLRLANRDIDEEKIRFTAMILRSEIMNMEKTKMPTPTFVHDLKNSSPEIPPLTTVFYQTLVGGLVPNKGEASQRKAVSLASDAVFTTSRGTVRPWKNTCLGLGLSSMLGSKTAVTLLNRLGHSVSYDECKRIETEIAYSCSSGGLETPAGIKLQSTLATGTAWDNFDLNMDTLDGKNTLHVTVGIAYQNIRPLETREDGDTNQQEMVIPVGNSVAGRPRRTFDAAVKTISSFHKNLKLSKFKFKAIDQDQRSNISFVLLKSKNVDFVWLVLSLHEKLPLFNGFYSQFVDDPLPLTTIAYMDPISQPPTRNDVVQETMLRSLAVANETNMAYHPVTYDLAVALKAFSIQSLMAPKFDRLIILLGHFHVELAFFGAVGTYIADSGVEYLLTETNVLAEGSLSGFVRGKLYNRCTRIHQLTAMALEKALFERYLNNCCQDEHDRVLEDIRNIPKDDIVTQRQIAQNDDFVKLLNDYEKFFHRTIKGELGETAAFWAVYVYLINRLYREFQRAVRTNDVEAYTEVLPSLVEIFFALNRPNYARWGSYFLEKLKNMDPVALDILKAGAFSTRRTGKTYSRSPVDLTLEQTVNRDAASSATGITHFANSESAFRRWCSSLSQRSMAVSELKDLCGIQPEETPSKQLQKWRIDRDNTDVEKLLKMLDNTCNPFAAETPDTLVNISTGKSADSTTSAYLLGTLQRGAELRHQFHKECAEDDSRLLKTVKRVKVQNFANSAKQKKPSREKKALGAAEGVRDAFGYLLSKTGLDLHEVLCFPITEIPLALAHTDGMPIKTDKAKLTKLLETMQSTTSQEEASNSITDVTLFDGGLILHEVLPIHNTSTYGKIIRDIMIKVCSGSGHSVHLVLDKYVNPSIKDLERLKRGAERNDFSQFNITGMEQRQQRKGTELSQNGAFKEALSQFLLNEIKEENFAHIIGDKTVYVSHGGNCLRFEVNSSGEFVVEKPLEFQGNHEEADTLLAFHVKNIGGRMMVRSSDTDVLVILLGLAAKMPGTAMILMDFGSGNNRRIINVTDISKELESRQTGLSEALIGFHALTGCDFNSAFYGKGKAAPLSYLEKDKNHVDALRSLCTYNVDTPAVTAYICRLYGHKGQRNINEARYQSFVKMTRGKQKDVQVKRINCSSLPPCEKTLCQHLFRANYVAMLWRLAHTPEPTKDLQPLNFGWIFDAHGHYVPRWFEGSCLPDELFVCDSEQNNISNGQHEEEMDVDTRTDDDTMSDGEPWSDDTESDYEQDEDV